VLRERPAPVVIDEFTSVIDRQIARIGRSPSASGHPNTDGGSTTVGYEWRGFFHRSQHQAVQARSFIPGSGSGAGSPRDAGKERSEGWNNSNYLKGWNSDC
jgi:hypothetical protein